MLHRQDGLTAHTDVAVDPAQLNSALAEGVRQPDDGQLSRGDTVGDDPAALHQQLTGLNDVPGLELVDTRQALAAAGQDAGRAGEVTGITRAPRPAGA